MNYKSFQWILLKGAQCLRKVLSGQDWHLMSLLVQEAPLRQHPPYFSKMLIGRGWIGWTWPHSLRHLAAVFVSVGELLASFSAYPYLLILCSVRPLLLAVTARLWKALSRGRGELDSYSRPTGKQQFGYVGRDVTLALLCSQLDHL